MNAPGSTAHTEPPSGDLTTQTGEQLPGSADALALARVAIAAQASKVPVAMFCARATDAARLQMEVAWFAPELRVTLFPDWETLPYDAFSPHHDLISERLETLHRIA